MRKNQKQLLSLLVFIFIAASTLNCQSYRDRWQQPEKIMDAVGIKEGMVIGECGAGDGYFTFKLSDRVGEEGRIYANDISRRALNNLKDRRDSEDIENIEIIEGDLTDPLFPRRNLDMVIMVYVIHDVEKPVEFLKNIKKYLKTGAQLVIVDRDPDRYGKEYDHFWKKDKMLDTVKEAGYFLDRVETFLSRDNIYVFDAHDPETSE